MTAAALKISNGVGTRSIHNGLHQRERQRWLQDEERRLLGAQNTTAEAGVDGRYYCSSHRRPSVATKSTGHNRRPERPRQTWETTGLRGLSGVASASASTEGQAGGVGAGAGNRQDGDPLEEVDEKCEEHLTRLRTGVMLWGRTYVPPIAPEARQRLITRWTGTGDGAEEGAPRILYVISSFDRGRRLRLGGYDGDKLDYILMMMDEAREACEVGFSPHVHLIAAWDPTPASTLIQERLFCQRTGQPVPFTFKAYSPGVRESLSIKHRVYMKSRVDDYDIFIQVEDDMILTVNHILRYLKESHRLAYRKKGSKEPNYRFVPGFMRVEPAPGDEGELAGYAGEWYEWEVILSRIHGTQISGAGVYLTLEPSKVLRGGGNNQGFWMATQGQLRHLDQTCGYLSYDERTNLKYVEWFSGSIEMFSRQCKLKKVFPAAEFEDFLVHHRTNNKNGKRGETVPAVPMTMLRQYASQILRDGFMLNPVG